MDRIDRDLQLIFRINTKDFDPAIDRIQKSLRNTLSVINALNIATFQWSNTMKSVPNNIPVIKQAPVVEKIRQPEQVITNIERTKQPVAATTEQQVAIPNLKQVSDTLIKYRNQLRQSSDAFIKFKSKIEESKGVLDSNNSSLRIAEATYKRNKEAVRNLSVVVKDMSNAFNRALRELNTTGEVSKGTRNDLKNLNKELTGTKSVTLSYSSVAKTANKNIASLNKEMVKIAKSASSESLAKSISALEKYKNESITASNNLKRFGEIIDKTRVLLGANNKEVNIAISAFDRNKKAIISLNSYYKKFNTYLEKARKEFAKTGSVSRSTAANLDRMRKEFNLLKSTTASYTATTRNAIRNIGLLNKEVKITSSANMKASVSTKQYDRSLKEHATTIDKVRKKNKALVTETMGGARVYGMGGPLMRGIALVRNHLLLYAFALGSVLVAIKKVIGASVEMRNSLVGLGAIAEKTGNSMVEAKEAAITLAKSGFISVKDAAMSLKNLLATGFNLPQAIKLIRGFGDSAAYNRQATFGWGESIVRTTEGIRLGLSQVADAAGMTKNLGQILKENGVNASRLSEVQSDLTVRTALYTGMLKELSLFQGNAAKAMNEYSGQVAKMNTSIFNLKALLGDSLIPILKIIVTDIQEVVNRWVDYLKVNKEIIRLKTTDYLKGVYEFVKKIGTVLKPLVATLWKLREVLTALFIVSTLGKGLVLLSKVGSKAIIIFGKFAYTLRLASRASSFLGKSMLPTLPLSFAKVFGWAGLVITVVTSLYLIYKKLHKVQVNNVETQLKEIANDKQRYSSLIKNNEELKNLSEQELDNIKIKIKAKGATKELTKQQDKYEKSIKGVSAELSNLNYQMSLLDVQKSKVFFQESTKDFEKLMREYKTIAGYGLGAKKIVSTGKLTKPDFADVSKADFDEVQRIRKDDVKSWIEYRDKVSATLEDIIKKQIEFKIKYAEGSRVDEKGRKNPIFTTEEAKAAEAGFNKVMDTWKSSYESLLTFINMNIPKPKNVAPKINPPDKKALAAWESALKRMKEAIQKVEFKTDYGEFVGNLKAQVKVFLDLGKAVGKYSEALRIAHKFIDVSMLKEQKKMQNKAADNYQKIAKKQYNTDLKSATSRADAWKKGYDTILKIEEDSTANIDNMRNTSLFREKNRMEAKIKIVEKAMEKDTRLEAKGIETIKTLRDEFTVYEEQKAAEVAQTWSQIFQQVGSVFTEVYSKIPSELKDTISQLNSELKRGTIQQEEYAARLGLAYRNAAIQATNAWHNAGRMILNTMSSYLQQMIAKAALTKNSMSAILSEAFSPKSLLTGGLMAAVGVGIGFLAQKLFPEKPQEKYQEINPATGAGGATTSERRTLGSISQAPIQNITITPTVEFSNNNQIWIAGNSVEAFSDELTTMMENMMQTSIDNGTLDLQGVSPR